MVFLIGFMLMLILSENLKLVVYMNPPLSYTNPNGLSEKFMPYFYT